MKTMFEGVRIELTTWDREGGHAGVCLEEMGGGLEEHHGKIQEREGASELHHSHYPLSPVLS